MKICEANEQTLGDAKSEPIKFSSLPLSSLLFPSPPFYFLPASRFIRFCRARSRGCTSSYLYVLSSRRKKIRDARKTSRAADWSFNRRNELKEIIRSRRTYRFRSLLAFQLADSCSEETLIGYQEAEKNNEIIANQYAAWRPTSSSRSKVAVQRWVQLPSRLRSPINFVGILFHWALNSWYRHIVLISLTHNLQSINATSWQYMLKYIFLNELI